jgi:hypothetical protein
MESHAERRCLARGEPLVVGVRSGAERARALRRLLDDLALGTLCLASAARELTTNPRPAELHADMVDIGVVLFGLEAQRLVRAADVVLGLGDPHVLPLLGAATCTPGLDRAGLLRISARHVLEARRPDARQGKEEALLTAWYAGSGGGGADLRPAVRKCYPAVRGERAVGLLEAIRLDLNASQLAALEQADAEIAREVVDAHRRCPMTAASLEDMVIALRRRARRAGTVPRRR